MPIITFWSDGKTETGKTASIAAIATFLSIENNYKTLVFNTNYNDKTLENCFWPEEKVNKGLFARNSKMIDVSEGITGLTKAIASNKTSPEIITNYTKPVFKKRLEILTDDKVIDEDYKKQRVMFKDIMKNAAQTYDLVLVDVNGSIEDPVTASILENSNLIIVTCSQKLSQIKEYVEIKKGKNVINNGNTVLLLGRYDKDSKYTSKNIARYIGEQYVYSIPYNTLFFEACNEGTVVDYFIKYRKVNPTERNSLFISSVQNAIDGILYYLREIQMSTY